MKIDGNKNCPRCNKENLIKELFTSTYYEECLCEPVDDVCDALYIDVAGWVKWDGSKWVKDEDGSVTYTVGVDMGNGPDRDVRIFDPGNAIDMVVECGNIELYEFQKEMIKKLWGADKNNVTPNLNNATYIGNRHTYALCQWVDECADLSNEQLEKMKAAFLDMKIKPIVLMSTAHSEPNYFYETYKEEIDKQKEQEEKKE